MAVGFSATAGDAILDTLVDTDYPWMQLHTGDPGAAGTANVAGNTTRKDTSAAWAPSSGGTKTTDVDITWSDAEVTTTETYTHFSQWTASTAGTFGFSGTVTALEVDATGESFAIASGNASISVNTAA